MMNVWKFGLVCALASFVPHWAQASEFDCGTLDNYGLGPFDYNDHPASARGAEKVHFKPDMQALNLRLYPAERLRGEFMYTLRVYPNHPAALNAFSRLEYLYGKQLPKTDRSQTAECFFDRAFRFRPQDPAVHFVYAMHLHQWSRLKDAAKAYAQAESLGEASQSFYYNYGLLQADLKNWPEAKRYAELAYSNGAQLPGLAQKIEKAGMGPVRIPSRQAPAPAPANEEAAGGSPGAPGAEAESK